MVALSPLKNSHHYTEAGAQVQKSVNLFSFTISRLTSMSANMLRQGGSKSKPEQRNCCTKNGSRRPLGSLSPHQPGRNDAASAQLQRSPLLAQKTRVKWGSGQR